MQLDERTLKKELSEGRLRNLYVICGDEPYLKEFYLNKIIGTAVNDDFKDFNLKISDGAEADMSSVLEGAEQLPLMGNYNCCVVKNTPFAKLPTEDIAALGEYVKSVPETTVLVFYQSDASFPPKSSKDDSPSDGAKERKKQLRDMYSSFSENSCIITLNKKSERELVNLLCSGAKKRGCALSAENAVLMVNLCGNSLHTLLNELEKLCAYVGNGEIDEDTVRFLTVKTTEATAFEIADNLLKGKTDKALQSLRILLEQKTPSQMIAGALIFPFVDMYRIKVAAKSGKTVRDVMKTFSYSSSFRLEKASKNSARIPLERIRTCLDILSDLDTKLKSFSGSDSVVLEETLVKLGNTICLK